MLHVPHELLYRYGSFLGKQEIPSTHQADYRKWLRYFLDFCDKYSVPESRQERLRMFIEKLREKKQTVTQRKHAALAISIYFDMLTEEDQSGEFPEPQKNLGQASFKRGSSHYCEAGYNERSDSPEWDKVLNKLAKEIKLRHYSRKTLKTYANWSRRFQRFLKNKPPHELSTADVKEYLTYLAVKCKVAASTQNQAFNSLLFLYRHALQSEFGDLRDVPRAKKSRYIPMVLSRTEIDAILKQLAHPFNLFIKILFGCGLRLFESLQLRVRDFNFGNGVLTVHGKGKKDRTVPLPKSIIHELKAQVETVARLHKKDLSEGYDGVFLDDAVEKKYPKAPKEFIHQWFFPMKSLTVTEAGERRRYHLHESDVQEALYKAVRNARITKRVLSPFIRHPFAPGQLRHPRHPKAARACQP